MTTQTTKSSDRELPSGRAEQGPPAEVVDRLAGLLPAAELEDALKGLQPDQITGPGGLLTQLAGRVIETALGAELTEHLGYLRGQAPPGGAGNLRNGSTPKTLQTELGPVGSRPRATAPGRLIRSWWPSARPGWRAWTTRSSGSTPAG
jgi:hypothetical protein